VLYKASQRHLSTIERFVSQREMYKAELRQWQKEHEKQSNHENLLLPSKEKTKAIG